MAFAHGQQKLAMPVSVPWAAPGPSSLSLQPICSFGSMPDSEHLILCPHKKHTHDLPLLEPFLKLLSKPLPPSETSTTFPFHLLKLWVHALLIAPEELVAPGPV